MSMVTRRPCEFCGTEFLHRLSGPEGVYGSRSTCPSCGKAPTPPVPRPESLVSARTMFPGLKVDRATEAPFVIESVEPKPLEAPNFRIFDLESVPRFYDFHMEDAPVGSLAKDREIPRELIVASLGIPKEFLEGGSSEYATAEVGLQSFERTVRRAQQEALERAYRRATKPVDLDTEYVDGMGFREFWLKNFPRILALKLGPGPKRLRKKRLKKALGAAYGGHLMAGFIKGTLGAPSFAEMIIPNTPVRVHETLVMEDGTRKVREFDVRGMHTDPGNVFLEEEPVFWPEGTLDRLLEKRPLPFAQEYQQEVQNTPHCATCGHAIDFHYRKNDPDKRLGPCRGHHTDCECTAFEERK